MTPPGYRSSPSALREAGTEVASHAQVMDQLKVEVRQAEVPTKAWGVLGLSLGLYAGYLQLLRDLEQHLHMSREHIDGLGAGLRDTADQYEQMERQLAKVFTGIKDDTDAWAEKHPEQAAGTAAEPHGGVEA